MYKCINLAYGETLREEKFVSVDGTAEVKTVEHCWTGITF
jgi:hypothetical protein